MKTLLLLRHAKSSWDDDQLADHDRPLNDRGRRDAPRIGQLLRDERMAPDRIVSSTALRARQTAEAAAEAAGYDDGIDFSDELYETSPRHYAQVVAGVSDSFDRVLVVGHNPAIAEFLWLLTRQEEKVPTACLIAIELPIDCWQDLRTDGSYPVKEIWRPKEL